MRLTCPNCGAQYEVPDEVIPPEGRDVQCSNCGDTWYHYHPDFPPAEAADDQLGEGEPHEDPSDDELRAALTEEPEPRRRSRRKKTELREEPADPEPEFEPEEEAFEDEYQEPLPETEDEFEEGDFEEDEFDDLEDEELQPQKPMDSSVSDILREEAEREARLRAEEAGTGLESQPDLGLDQQPDEPLSKRAQEARDRMARLRGEPTPTEEQSAGARRELLPDIEEINSTLRGTGKAVVQHSGATPQDAVPVKKSGFMRGFSIAVIIAVILTVIYARSQQIAQAVPQTDPMLSAYVAIVDQGRIWLAAKVGPFVAPQ